jgi:hypothetical protein
MVGDPIHNDDSMRPARPPKTKGRRRSRWSKRVIIEPRFSPDQRRQINVTILPRYQRRMPEVNEAIVATYLAGGNTRRLRGALQPLLKAAPLSKSAVSRVIATLKAGLEAWRTHSLTDLHLEERDAAGGLLFCDMPAKDPNMRPAGRKGSVFHASLAMDLSRQVEEWKQTAERTQTGIYDSRRASPPAV